MCEWCASKEVWRALKLSSAALETVVSPYSHRSWVCALYDRKGLVFDSCSWTRCYYLQPHLITEDSAGDDKVLEKVLLTKILPKGKIGVVHVMQTGSGVITPRILYLCASWRWVVSLTTRLLPPPSPLPPGKELGYVLARRLCGPQSRSGHFGEQKNLLALQRLEPYFLGCPVR